MKYCKPETHFISAAKANAECVPGSGTTDDGECLTGDIVLAGPCQNGDVAGGNCKTGACADNCVSVGTDVGFNCCAGTGAT